MVSLLASPKFERSELLAKSVIRELEKPLGQPPPEGSEAVTLDRSAVLQVNERFSDPQLGEGLLRLEAANPEVSGSAAVIKTLSESGVVPEIDKLARTLPDDQVAELSRNLIELSKQGDTAGINSLVTSRLAGAGRINL